MLFRKLLQLESSNFTHIYTASSTVLEYKSFSTNGRLRGAVPPSFNLEPPHILETIRARKLKSYMHLDTAKYTFQV